MSPQNSFIPAIADLFKQDSNTLKIKTDHTAIYDQAPLNRSVQCTRACDVTHIHISLHLDGQRVFLTKDLHSNTTASILIFLFANFAIYMKYQHQQKYTYDGDVISICCQLSTI